MDQQNESSAAAGRRLSFGFEPIAPSPVRSAAAREPVMLEGYARLLEESGGYRILRRLAPRPPSPMFNAPGAMLGLFVDVETTGLDAATDEVIELAAVPFQFTETGRILAVHQPISQLREPLRPIPAHITELTGIDDATVCGRTIDEAAISPLLDQGPLVIAHNSAFDRPFLERLLPGFAHVPWACSMSEVPWRDNGMRALGLSAIAAELGFFYEAHRATDDCLAAIEILGRPLRRSGGSPMAELARRAGAASCRVWAAGSPFEAKDILKRRGYRWSNGSDGRPKCWFIDVGEAALDAELDFLRHDIFFRLDLDLPVTRLTAYDRFSARF